MNLRQLIESSEQGEVKDDCVIHCMIIDSNPIKRSRGTDFFRQLFLVDETIDGAWRGYDKIEVMLFARDEHSLPGYCNPIRRGDILRMEKVQLGLYLDRPQLKGKIGKMSSFRYQIYSVNEGEVEDDMPYDHHEASSIPMGESDRARLNEMRKFSVERQAQIAVTMALEKEGRSHHHQQQGFQEQDADDRRTEAAAGAHPHPHPHPYPRPAAGPSHNTGISYKRSLSSHHTRPQGWLGPSESLPTPNLVPVSNEGPVMVKKVSDVVAKAISRQKIKSIDFMAKVVSLDNRDPSFVVAFLWDGDDAPPLSHHLTLLPILDPPVHCPGNGWSRRRQVQPVNGASISSLHVLSDELPALVNSPLLPEAGTFVPLLFPTSTIKGGASQIEMDGWYKFKNLVPIIVRGQLQLLYVPKSKMTLRPNDKMIQSKISDYESRLTLSRLNIYSPSNAADLKVA